MNGIAEGTHESMNEARKLQLGTLETVDMRELVALWSKRNLGAVGLAGEGTAESDD